MEATTIATIEKNQTSDIRYPCKLAIDHDLSKGRFKAADYGMAHERPV
ncbi:MAG: hypothetical protein O7B81_12800 [Gammaproteobacteria bacterium]|nr:hypothetical protein [Gammaproteobacteria bacterium]